MIESVRGRNAHSWWRRLRVWLRSMLGAAVKTHRVHWVAIGGVRYKRMTFSHASDAMRVERNLERVAPLSRFPALVYRHEHRVWVKFVEGGVLEPSRPAHVEGVVGLFADLYRHESYQVDLSDTVVHQRLLADLAFLREVGVLTSPLGSALADAAHRLRPDRAWLGFEYIDPLCRNFIAAPAGVFAIDVEALHAECLLGVGLAKARLRWLEIETASLLETLVHEGAPDLRPQFDYAALSQLAAYSKQKVFRGRRRSIRPGDFERVLERTAS